MELATRYGEYVLTKSGKKFPAIICGMFQIKDPMVVMTVMDQALASGYRSFDTAAVYKNESLIGDIFQHLLKKHG